MCEPEELYPDGFLVWADRRVQCGTTTFVRVQGTSGWLFTSSYSSGKPTLTAVPPGQLHDAASPMPADAPQLPLESVRSLARRFDCREVQLNPASCVIAFTKQLPGTGAVRINVYYTTGTVGTALDHPDQGRTQLFRWGCSLDDLQRILDNPRVHSGRGYKRKRHAPATASSLMPQDAYEAGLPAGGGSEEGTLRESLCALD